MSEHQIVAYFDTGFGDWKAICSCDWETWGNADRDAAINSWAHHRDREQGIESTLEEEA